MIKSGSKLLRKGLIVIIIPMVFQLVFLATLASFLHHAQVEVQKTIESKKVVAAATTLVARIIDAELIALFYNVNRFPFLEMKYGEEKRKAEQSLQELLELCQSDKKRVALSKPIQKTSQRTLDRLADMFTEEFDEEINVSKYVGTDSRTNKTYHMFTIAYNNVDKLIDSENRRQTEVKKRQKYYSSMIRKVIIGGVALNVILTIVLAIIFTLGTTIKLKTVLENTRRLKDRVPLAPPVGGDDEITQLDTVFHATANDLTKLDKQRKELVKLVRDELSTPLKQVQFSLHNLSQGILAELSEKAQTRLTMAALDTDRVIRLIDDLLSIEDMEGASFDLLMKETTSTNIINLATSSVKQLADRGNITLEVVDPQTNIIADKDRLVQVLINFLSNAIKFSESNSRITISLKSQDDRHLFSVEDRGRGIPEDKLDDVFERFKQVDSKDQVEKGGTGLGLPICKSIVEQHGGTIGVNSEYGTGSTFWFEIPSNLEEQV